MARLSFRRPHLARQFCLALQGDGLMDARSGLFLTARRRVGKSTFLREDLVPEAEALGWAVVYVDLWRDKAADPAMLLADAVKKALVSYDGVVLKAARAAKLSKVSVMGTLTLDLDNPGLPEGVSLVDAIELLHAKAEKPLILIVDEAQHALTTEKGANAMFALKAARDHLNPSDGDPQLMLVLTGSNRDKLSHLVINRSQPFFGSRVTPFPLLGREFTDQYTEWVNKNLSPLNQLKNADVYEAFLLVGNRPEILRDIIGDVVLQGEAPNLSDLLKYVAQDWHAQIWGDYESAYAALTALQKSVISAMALKGPGFAPFNEPALAFYRKVTGESEISVSSVQAALESLRERELVWKESRGAYAIEDDGFATWLSSFETIKS